MNLTLSLDEPLAEQLRQRASDRAISLEEAARDVFVRAMQQIAEEETWRATNQRRLELIAKGRHGLTALEADELDRLQAAADQP